MQSSALIRIKSPGTGREIVWWIHRIATLDCSSQIGQDRTLMTLKKIKSHRQFVKFVFLQTGDLNGARCDNINPQQQLTALVTTSAWTRNHFKGVGLSASLIPPAPPPRPPGLLLRFLTISRRARRLRLRRTGRRLLRVPCPVQCH